MGVKKSVMLSDATVAIMQQTTRKGETISWSGQVNGVFMRYDWVMRQALPKLNQEEWQAILNVYAGCLVAEYSPPFRIASDVMDDMGEISIDALDDLKKALVIKAHDMSQAEQAAVLYFVDKFWCGEWNDCKDWDEIYGQLIKKPLNEKLN